MTLLPPFPPLFSLFQEPRHERRRGNRWEMTAAQGMHFHTKGGLFFSPSPFSPGFKNSVVVFGRIFSKNRGNMQETLGFNLPVEGRTFP